MCLKLDPRTKLYMIVVVSAVVMMSATTPFLWAVRIAITMIPLLFSCVNIGDELSAAAVTRGLGGKVKRTSAQVLRIACASAAALLPDIILLDEPSSNLDMRAISMLHDIILEWKNQGKTIIISEHRLWYLKDLADRVIYMDKGRIAHEWSGKEFAELLEEETKPLKLRPTSINKHYLALLSDNGNEKLEQPDISDGITLKDFYFSYHHKPYIFRKKKFSAADGEALSLCIPKLILPKGKVTAVIGSNGTGKSTFLRCVCGLEKDCTGVIVSDGKEYRKRQRIGFSYLVMQDVNHQLFTDSVENEVLLSMKVKDVRYWILSDFLNIRTHTPWHFRAVKNSVLQ